MQKQNLIYTLGTSNLDWDSFLAILKEIRIELLVDVRRFPTSRFEHFQKKLFQELLKQAGIEYLYLGNELGGFRTGGYEIYVKSESFAKGLELLQESASKKRSVLVCAEKSYLKCHRRFIADALVTKNRKVIHLEPHSVPSAAIDPPADKKEVHLGIDDPVGVDISPKLSSESS